MIGNVLYGVVASSGSISSGGGPDALVFVDEAHTPDTQSGQTASIDLNFDEVGTYIVACYGQAGNTYASRTTLMEIDSVASFSWEEVDYINNDEFETIRFIKADITTAGTHTVQLSTADSNGIYRAGAACWRLEGDFATAALDFFTISGSASDVLTHITGEAFIAIALGRDSTPGDLTDNTFSGLSQTDADFALLDTADQFYYKLLSEDVLASDGDVTITHTPSGNATRAEVAVVQIRPTQKYPSYVRNPGAERGMDNWTTLNGDIVSSASEAGISPHSGERFFYGGENSTGDEMWQNISIPADMMSLVQAGNAELTVTYEQASFSLLDRGRPILKFFDSSDTLLETNIEAWSAGGEQVWETQEHRFTIPTTADYYELRIEMQRQSGSNNNAYFDDFSVQIAEVIAEMTVLGARTLAVVGRPVGELAVAKSMSYAVVGRPVGDLALTESLTYVVIKE